MERRSDQVARAKAEPVEVVEHDPTWADAFAAEAAELRRLLPSRLLGRVEHFGSTAVPGLAAKPIVDVLVETPDLERVRAEVAPLLEARGYAFFWRPPSPGDAEVDYAWFIKRRPDGSRSHHVHFLPPGPAFDARLAFRDRLRADPELARAYGDLKRRAAAAHRNDRAAYAAAKSRFIARTLAGREA
jgi:GrpB-like predicted nucleotidyltransferase (UPF0157 family)